MIENQKIVLKKKLPIIFVGMPGSGKSTVAKQISEKLNLPFVDTDYLFQLIFDATPKEIILTQGEIKFREMEKRVLNELLDQNELIVATGGGLPCFNNQMETLNNWGTTVFLNCKIENLVERMKFDNSRPLITENLSLNLENLYLSRFEVYQNAHVIVDANKEIDQVVSSVLDVLKD